MRANKHPFSSLLFMLLMISTVFSSCDHSPKKRDSMLQKAAASKVKRQVIVEIILPKDSVFNSHALYDLAKGFALDNHNINQWKDRIMVYADISNADDLIKSIRSAYAQDTIKVFDTPFYTFNRRMCADTISSKQWDNIFLSANLVDDPKLQQEYLNYHATQFKNWPEVSAGFCNANFQQLLVFKNGRQLMLVISIPKGESLDKLNPKTTENNPRVDDWNKLMRKYQEGLPGAEPGEVWMLFKPINNINKITHLPKRKFTN
jgi:L-rhamnose mutarotase